MTRWLIGFLLLAGLWMPGGALGTSAPHAVIDRVLATYEVNRDLTFTRTRTVDITLNGDNAVHRFDRAAETFYPDKQALEVVEAWVDQPDGTRTAVGTTGIFTRPSAASQSAPGFVSSLTTTVLFPRLTRGSRTHVVWRFTQKTPPLLGFNVVDLRAFEWDTRHAEVRIALPAGVPLVWRARGGYAVTDRIEDGVRRIEAVIGNTEGHEPEPAMVSPADHAPAFLATTLPDAEAAGAIVHAAARGRAEVTPEIAALAERIAGTRTDLDAVRALHAWVAANIRYVAVYLNPDDGWVPHSAAAVLNAGYGDCKDYVVLLRALLAARGIAAEMAVIHWGDRYADPPLWVPFYNHAILYLPAHDLYLNPTDRMAPFGALDRRLSDKPVMIMTEEGRTARTPPATPEANRYRYAASVVLTPDGTVEGTARYTLTPNAEIPIRNALASATSPGDLARRLLSATPECGFGDFHASDPADLATPLVVTGHWRSPEAVNRQDGETFLRVPTGLDFQSPAWERRKLSVNGTRRTPVVADIGDTGWDIVVTLPATLALSHLPPDVDVRTGVGRYTARYRAVGDTVVVARDLVIAQQVVAPERAPELERLIYAALVDARAVIALAPAVR